MTISYTCTACGAVLKIRDEKAGTEAKCPKCRTAFVVPHLAESADSDVVIGAAISSDAANAAPSAAEPSAAEPSAAEPSPAELSATGNPVIRKQPAKKQPATKQPADERIEDDDDAVAEKFLFSDPSETESLPGPSDEITAGDFDDDVDEPFEVTPGAPPDDFDPLDVLSTRSQSGARPSTAGAGDEKKVSVADMMRDFNASKKKRAARQKNSEESEQTEVVATSGSAAEAIARAYQQKRESAAAPKVRRPTRADAERKLMNARLKRAIPAVLGSLLLGYGLFFLITLKSYSGVPLAPVSGNLTQENHTLKDFRITLVPILTDEESQQASNGRGAPGKSTSFGFTNEKGEFYMRYTAEVDGAAICESRVEIYNPSGVPVAVPESFSRVTVKADGPNELIISL